MFDLMTSTGVLFTYTSRVPNPSQMQMVDFYIDSPYTDPANVLSMNVASLALLGRTVEQILVDHVEHYQALAAEKEGKR